jgi:hypothetical protein
MNELMEQCEVGGEGRLDLVEGRRRGNVVAIIEVVGAAPISVVIPDLAMVH